LFDFGFREFHACLVVYLLTGTSRGKSASARTLEDVGLRGTGRVHGQGITGRMTVLFYVFESLVQERGQMGHRGVLYTRSELVRK